ncbi:type II 3-dehydroquinate dehydratase [Candidatus Paracaedibacter symbiosus]|uniref:type II 3-dehydroquinate dehydratase n=1 Tax=Candidatus Paracaedibacter symbiosus TaxID=244582 RepID=UPI000509581A|nr:type II 3-dehydroquinate dehydratase [Candidatus Paracaedibacter symbiosus]
MRKTIWVLNGPNLNKLGGREPELYGSQTLAEIEQNCQHICTEADIHLEFRQTNHEGMLIDWIQEASTKAAGLIINAAAYTHSSIAICDALKLVKVPSVEVHLTNIYQREPFRHHSYISPCVNAVIAGFAGKGYTMAIRAIIELIR